MRERLRRWATSSVAVLALFYIIVYVQFGTEWGYDSFFLSYFLFVVIAGFVLISWRLNWRERLTGGVTVLGVGLFVIGVFGGSGGCTSVGFPSNVEHGVTYLWKSNRLLFGDHIGMDYRCFATPYRVVVVFGYLLTTIGVVSFLSIRDAVENRDQGNET